MNLYKIMIGIGIALIVFIPIWFFLIVPGFEKLPSDFNRELELLLISNERYVIGSDWIGEHISRAILNQKTTSIEGNNQIIESNYLAKTIGGELIWESIRTYELNRKTRKILDKDEYLIFPNKLKKQNYVIWPYGYNNKFDFKYIGIEEINNLKTYHYSVSNVVSDDTEGYSWLDDVPEKYNVLSKQSIDLYVEPISGTIVNFKDEGISYYVDKTTNDKVQDLLKWNTDFSQDTITNQVRLADNEKQKILLMEWILPLLLFLIAMALILSSFIGKKFVTISEEEKENKNMRLPKKKISDDVKKPILEDNSIMNDSKNKIKAGKPVKELDKGNKNKINEDKSKINENKPVKELDKGNKPKINENKQAIALDKENNSGKIKKPLVTFQKEKIKK